MNSNILRRSVYIYLLLILAFSAQALCTLRAFADDQVTLSAIAQGWTKRFSRIQSADVTWKETRIMDSDAFQANSRVVGGGKGKVMTFGPFPSSLTYAGNMFRYETVGAYDTFPEDGKTARRISAFDGDGNQAFSPDTEPLSGSLGAEKVFSELNTLQVRPIMLALRSPQPQFIELRDDRVEISDRIVMVDGKECVVVTYRPQSVPSTLASVFWLVPTENYKVVRWELQRNGEPAVLVKIQYAIHPGADDLPVSWEASSFALDGSIREASKASDVKVVINRPVTKADFQLTYPAGTVVGDRRDGKAYVVADDGSFRLQSGIESRVGQTAGGSYWLIGCAVIATIAGALMLWRFRRAPAAVVPRYSSPLNK
jgi:hypothetical protein